MSHGKVLKKWILPLVITAGALFIYVRVSSFNDPPRRPRTQESVQRLLSQVIQVDTLSPQMRFFGRVRASREIDIVTEVPGRILEKNFNMQKGALFSRGDILYEIDRGEVYYDIRSSLEGLKNSLSRALPEIGRDLPQAYDRWSDFYSAVEGLNLPSLPETDSDREDRVLTRFRVFQEYYSIRKLLKRYGKHVYRAPFSGAVLESSVHPASFVQAGASMGRLVQTDQASVDLGASAEELDFLAEGMDAHIITARGDSVRGEVEIISPVISPHMQRFFFSVGVDDPFDSGIRIGEYREVLIFGSSVYPATQLPRSALQENNIVYCIENKRLVQRSVTLLYGGEDMVYIGAGLSAGDTVVVEPVSTAMGDMAVEPLCTGTSQE
jgi:multidrug efflux pump subunit AcrA (membrane-fusion protein)